MPRPPVKTATFNGIKHKIAFQEDPPDGYCIIPDRAYGEERTQNSFGEIAVASGLSPQRTLEVLIHESLHASFPRMSEERVDRAGREIANLLFRLGYRLTRS